MKFVALLKKECRICLPWLLLIAMACIVIGTIIMKTIVLDQSYYGNQGFSENDYYGWSSTRYSPISPFGPLLLIASLVLGLILGVIQFFLPGLFKTWAFTVHRSIKPQSVIWSKFTAALITFMVSLGLLWTLFYSYAAVPGRFNMPIFFRIYLDGWIYILAGLIVYWGTALSAISTTHIFTTRLLGLAIATCVIFLMLLQTSIIAAVIWAAAGVFVLTIQIFDTFLTREF